MRFSQLPWRDSTQTYGRVSRLFHWGMAALLLWQFTSTVVRVLLARDSALYEFFRPTHTQVGFAILVTAIARGGWGLFNAAHRPSHGEGLVARLAMFGHLGLYGLMILVPALALLRLRKRARILVPRSADSSRNGRARSPLSQRRAMPRTT